jgi:hypothetical protein
LKGGFNLEIKKFAKHHGLKTSTDVDGTTIIRGIDASHIYEHDAGTLAVMFMDSIDKDSKAHRALAFVTGMEILLDGDFEFAATFDPRDEKQSRAAVKIAGCRYPGTRLKTMVTRAA